PHARVFHVEVYWEETRVGGEGRTIKAAEMDAARRALAQMSDGEVEDSRQKAEGGRQPADRFERCFRAGGK
ncbi:MAG: putative dsRNA-binding protein, partial [Pyrinomonadaceae bacterium]